MDKALAFTVFIAHNGMQEPSDWCGQVDCSCMGVPISCIVGLSVKHLAVIFGWLVIGGTASPTE